MIRQTKNLYHWLVAWVAHLYYRMPGRKIKLIGITGTDGKTTTSSLIYHVLKSVGKKVSVITTVSAIIGDTHYDTGFHVTTPDPHHIPKYLSKAIDHGDGYMVFEITSHALDQHRAAPLRFEVSGITNITHEHLDYHRTMDRYIHAKAKLIGLSKATYINADQPDVVQKLRSFADANHRVHTYGIKAGETMKDISSQFGYTLEEYNKSNFLLAYCICRHLGVTDEQFGDAIATFTPPSGRMEVVGYKPFVALIDFAHTPHAIEQALSAIRKKYPQGTLIHVFGSAAKRDVTKRPRMGASSASFADITVLTEEDHRDENPFAIAQDIAKGLESKGFQFHTPAELLRTRAHKSYCYVYDREQALAYACKIAKPGDIVVATGKGHEKSLARGGKEYSYDERAIFERLLRDLI